MSFMDKMTDMVKNAGGVAQDLAKNAGEAAQELAKAAQDKAAYLKELQSLKSAIREQEGLILAIKTSIADKILDTQDGMISQEVQELWILLLMWKRPLRKLKRNKANVWFW